MLRRRPLAAIAAAALLSACSNSGSGGGLQQPPPRTFDYDIPLAKTSPWPQMRRNRLSNGRSPVAPVGGGLPWKFQTDKGIFSIPVIGPEGEILVGSADRSFYALNPDGTVKWSFPTGEIIDSAAAVAEDGTIYVPSGDGNVYALNPDGSRKWNFAARHMAGQPAANQGTTCGYPAIGGPSNWFEGNVVIGPGGQLWAGNDNYRMYGLRPDGSEIFAFHPGPIPFGTVWSAATTRLDGSGVFGSLDFFLYSITKDGACQWRAPMGALVTASPAQSDDGGTFYAGSWDSNFYAVDGATGAIDWVFPTREHIYGSAAIAEDGTIYFGSVDGTLYALNPDGSLKWTFDTLDPIRSSPAVAGDGTVFFTAGDGRIYALNPDGSRRWSYDTTTQDRNDLNSSPALGLSALYVGGEDGAVHAMPYSYCETTADPRCSVDPSGDLPNDGARLFYVSPGGRSFETVEQPVQRASALTFRLVVREGGRTLRAGLVGSDVTIALAPFASFDISEQAGGQWVNIVPRASLAAATTYRAVVTARWTGEGGRSGTVAQAFDFKTVAERAAPDLTVKGDRAEGFELRNLAPYQPPLIVSLNQIGFDSVDFLGSVIRTQGDKFILWLVSGKPGEEGTVIDPATPSLVAMNGTLSGASFEMEGAGLRLVTGGPPIDIARFRLASQFDEDGAFDAGTSVLAEANCFDLGAVGLFLLAFDLCNSDFDFVSVGTMRGRAYDGAANRRPAGVSVTGVSFDGSAVTATFDAPGYKLADHLPAIVLVDGMTGEAAGLPYRARLTAAADGSGDLAGVRLSVPPGAVIPGRTRAVVLADLFPVVEAPL